MAFNRYFNFFNYYNKSRFQISRSPACPSAATVQPTAAAPTREHCTTAATHRATNHPTGCSASIRTTIRLVRHQGAGRPDGVVIRFQSESPEFPNHTEIYTAMRCFLDGFLLNDDCLEQVFEMIHITAFPATKPRLTWGASCGSELCAWERNATSSLCMCARESVLEILMMLIVHTSLITEFAKCIATQSGFGMFR